MRRCFDIHEAYTVLSDPEKRAQYDVIHETQLQAAAADRAAQVNDFGRAGPPPLSRLLHGAACAAHPAVTAELRGLTRLEHLEFAT
jgi:DnaJ-class molecular chaperone